MFGRTLKLSIVKDNGRSEEFDSKRIYTDKQRCYECGEEGHLSYKCPVNVLGNRDIPPKKNKNKQPKTDDEKRKTTSSNSNDIQCTEDVSPIFLL